MVGHRRARVPCIIGPGACGVGYISNDSEAQNAHECIVFRYTYVACCPKAPLQQSLVGQSLKLGDHGEFVVQRRRRLNIPLSSSDIASDCCSCALNIVELHNKAWNSQRAPSSLSRRITLWFAG